MSNKINKEKLKEIWNEIFEEYMQSKEGIQEMIELLQAYEINKAFLEEIKK